MKGWACVLTVICALAIAGPVPVAPAQSLPVPAHIVIVVEENKPDSGVIGSKSAPYLNALATNGANMTQSFAETHPSEPNYLALFSGDTFGLASDACPVNTGAAPNLGSELLAAGYTFAGFSEDLPAVGSEACSAGKYARKHAPWANFTNVPASASVPFSAFNNRTDFASLPTVSFVIPNLDNDMHDGSITQADTWMYNNLSRYANWAVANNSLLIITFDEDDGGSKNQIPTVIYGAHVKPGPSPETISHYNLLSTIEEMYGLPKTGLAANAPAISSIWV
jgi:phosphatidylinositol-3-phosphatase